jgi:5'-phosphate synthase pdxT subunit
VLSKFKGSPVLVREGSVMVASFHPELAVDDRVHELFLEMM